MAHFFVVVGGSKIHERLAHFFIDIYISPLFPGVPAPSVVIYVVKNASRPVSGEDSPVPDGKRFAFQIICIVTLSRVLCKWFLSRGWLKG